MCDTISDGISHIQALSWALFPYIKVTKIMNELLSETDKSRGDYLIQTKILSELTDQIVKSVWINVFLVASGWSPRSFVWPASKLWSLIFLFFTAESQ